MTEAAWRRYHIHEVLGVGGFGTVYRGECRTSAGLVKPVAIKLLHAKYDEADEILQRLRDEARVLAQISHRAIIRVDDLVRLKVQGDRWAIVMEYIDGANLRQVLEVTQAWPLSAALECAGELASALHAAHTQENLDGDALGLIHRDIKPENIQLTRHGEVRLLDFGIARASFKSREAHTAELRFGSPAYMAPERFRGEDGHKGDVYGLGVVLYELLTAERFGRTSSEEEPHRVLVRRARARLRHGVPADVAALVLATLSFDEGARPDADTVRRTTAQLRQLHGGEALADWVGARLPYNARRIDELCGCVLSASAEEVQTDPIKDPLSLPYTFGSTNDSTTLARAAARQRPSRVWALRIISIAGLAATLALGVFLLAVIALANGRPDAIPEVRPPVDAAITLDLPSTLAAGSRFAVEVRGSSTVGATGTVTVWLDEAVVRRMEVVLDPTDRLLLGQDWSSLEPGLHTVRAELRLRDLIDLEPRNNLKMSVVDVLMPRVIERPVTPALVVVSAAPSCPEGSGTRTVRIRGEPASIVKVGGRAVPHRTASWTGELSLGPHEITLVSERSGKTKHQTLCVERGLGTQSYCWNHERGAECSD